MENKIYNQLLLDFQKRFGSLIQKVSQLKILQERIANTTKKKIILPYILFIILKIKDINFIFL